MSRRICPKKGVLSDYAVGRLAPSARQAVDNHLETCAECLEALETMHGEGDSLVEALALPVAVESFIEESSYWNGLEKVRQLGKQLLSGCDAPSSLEELPESRQLGPYALIEQIGEGGMGTVWRAEQTEPVKRTVAIKLIKHGLGTDQILARFDAERQALALMEHPNIAKVLDAGSAPWRMADGGWRIEGKESADEPRVFALPVNLQSAINNPQLDGRPFFVMELVNGLPVTRFCDQQRLTVRQRLELFIPVCQAVQHAHQKGVIHRDLKPSNVLVAIYDGKPIPKVIDFGISKAAGINLSEHTVVTGFGGVVGTLEYMSPEQAEFNAVDIDTRSDIFALGVLLYELLVGVTPLTRQQLKAAGPTEALRLIREQEPARPSARVRDSGRSQQAGPTIGDISAQRHVDPAKLARMLRGDLDWIVLKALEKDRDRRYETASALALNIERCLRDEPILARPPSAFYRLRKFARRNKRPLIAAAVVLLALVGGMVGTTLGLVEARRQSAAAELARQKEANQRLTAEAERNRAVRAEDEAKVNAATALTNEKEARQSEKETRALWEFFKSNVVEAARPPDRHGGLGIGASIASALLNAEPAIASAFKEQPLVEATLRNTLGSFYLLNGNAKMALMQHQMALTLRQQWLGPHHADTLATKNNLALAFHAAGRLPDTIRLHEELLELRKAMSGPYAPETLNTMQNLAGAWMDAGQTDDALALYQKIFEVRAGKLGPDDPDTLQCAFVLAQAYAHLHRSAEALPLLEQTVKTAKSVLPVDHLSTLTYASNLANLYLQMKRPNDALKLSQALLSICQKNLGPDHGDTLAIASLAAQAEWNSGRQVAALSMFEDVMSRSKRSLGEDDRATVSAVSNVAFAYFQLGRYKDAIPLYETTLRHVREHPEPVAILGSLALSQIQRSYPDLLATMTNLADAYLLSGRAADALPLGEHALHIARSQKGPTHPFTLGRMTNLARAYHDAGRSQDALPLATNSLTLHRVVFGNDNLQTLSMMNTLGSIYFFLARYADAEALMRECAEGTRKQLGLDHLTTQLRLGNLAECLEHLHAVKAEPIRRELVEAAKTKNGPDSAYFAERLGNLGRNLVLQRKFVEAEPILRDCLRISQKQSPEAWANYVTMSLLGASLAGQKQYAAAEPLILQSYEGVKRHAEARASRSQRTYVPETLKLLVDLYEAWDRPAEAERWRKELAALKQK